MKEYQQKKMKEFLLPETVYRQALWAAKDLPRLKERLELKLHHESCMPGSSLCERTSQPGRYSDFTGKRASEIANLAMRVESIESALFTIPEKYREGMQSKLFYGKEFGDDFHPNTWKKWQQVYIYNVAVNLGIY